MKGIVKFLGIVSVAVGAAAVTAIALNDEQVRAKVVHATEQVKQASLNQVEKNQAWVDEQWEALGI